MMNPISAPPVHGGIDAEHDGDGDDRLIRMDPRSTSDVVDPATALRETEDAYRAIFELASDAIFVHDVETGAILDANRRACELHGCTLSELMTMGISGISDGDAPFDTAHAREYVRLAAEGHPQRFEWLVRHRDGSRFWVEVSLHRISIRGTDRILASVRNIDDRKQAQAELERIRDDLERRVEARTVELADRSARLIEAEQRFRAIVEASPTPLLLSRVDDGRILYVNDRLESLIGAEPGSLLGKKTPDYYFYPEDRPRVVAQVLEQGYIRDLELRIRRMDGTPRWVSLSVQRLDFGGTPAFASALVDITERRDSADALRQSEESFRGLFDNLTELVYIQGLDGRFINVNEAVVRAYGYAREELIGQEPAILAAPDRVDVEATMEHFRRAVKGEPQRFDWWGRRKDGTIFPKEVVLKRSTYFGQDVVIAVARDISDRVAAEEKLRQSEKHFRRMIENASDLISIMDVDGVIKYQSCAVTRLLGYSPEEMIGKNAFDYLAPEDVAETRARWRTAVENPGTPAATEFRFRHRDGSWRVMEAIGTTLSTVSAREGVVVNSRDVTERKRSEATLRLQKTLLEAQGEASIDGILVVNEDGGIVSYNQRFIDLWGLTPEVVASRSDDEAIQSVLDQLQDPSAFLQRVAYLYAHPEKKARDEIVLRDGRVFDRYSAPVVSSEGDRYGRIWFFRDITVQKRHAEELELARRDAEHAREQARQYARSLERELEFGRKIQQGLFPAKLPQPDGWEVAVRFRPVWQVAGDFYDAFTLPTGRIGLMIADVSGKGVGAALFMALFQSLLRASAERAGTLELHDPPSDEVILLQAINATNAYISRVHAHAHMFASVFFGLLDPETGSLYYVNAGQEPPVITSPDGPQRRLDTTGPALGLLADAGYTVEHDMLEPGELLLAYTDGVTEARNELRHFFAEERLLDLVRAPAESAAALLDRIEQAVRDFSGDAPRSDDVTMLAVRRHG